MVIFADEYPDAWFGRSFTVRIRLDERVLVNTVKITGATNGQMLLATGGDFTTPTPFMNAQAFAKALLSGKVQEKD